jgi:hypothetical protein
VGDALLPRFVVFGSAIILPDWFRICGRMAAGGRLRAEGRDRVVWWHVATRRTRSSKTWPRTRSGRRPWSPA